MPETVFRFTAGTVLLLGAAVAAAAIATDQARQARSDNAAVLQEVRELRREFHTFAVLNEKRLTALEVKSK